MFVKNEGKRQFSITSICFLSCFFAIVIIVFCICYYNKFNSGDNSLVIVDGQTYSLLEYSSDASYRTNDRSLKTGSKQKILKDLNSDDTLCLFDAPLSVEGAGKYGISILNKVFPVWTFDNHVCVYFNLDENIWLVHGQVEDRYSDDNFGIVMFEATTGKVLDIDLVKTGDGSVVLTEVPGTQGDGSLFC